MTIEGNGGGPQDPESESIGEIIGRALALEGRIRKLADEFVKYAVNPAFERHQSSPDPTTLGTLTTQLQFMLSEVDRAGALFAQASTAAQEHGTREQVEMCDRGLGRLENLMRAIYELWENVAANAVEKRVLGVRDELNLAESIFDIVPSGIRFMRRVREVMLGQDRKSVV